MPDGQSGIWFLLLVGRLGSSFIGKKLLLTLFSPLIIRDTVSSVENCVGKVSKEAKDRMEWEGMIIDLRKELEQ